MRIMGLDYGTKTVGVALSDPLLMTAQPYETILRENPKQLRKTVQRIEAIIAAEEVSEIVLGFPKNMNNTEGERAEDTKAFQEMLERRTMLPVHLMDERLTTVEADRILEETGVAHSARKEHIDKMAAAIILQTYLDGRNRMS
ncbi:MAG: Holliday junction resolvase RuvX [Eubacterium sp.]|nr:Holliday junction resolvase RuvX [Eubacterium sp.]